MSDETKWTLLTVGATALAAVAARELVGRGWSALGRTPPPDDPELDETGPAEILVWSLAGSALAGLARVGARRLSAGLWRRSGKGSPPA